MPPSEEPANPIDPPIDPLGQYEQSVSKPLPPPHGRLWVQLVLLALTLVTTTLAGVGHYQFFKIDLALLDQPAQLQQALTASITNSRFYLQGLWYSLTILLIPLGIPVMKLGRRLLGLSGDLMHLS